MSPRRPTALLFLLLALPLGCSGRGGTPDLIWGARGYNDGKFVRPRAAAIGPGDRLYIVDYTARIQVFDLDGKYLGPTWTTPDFRIGRPSGSLSTGTATPHSRFALPLRANLYARVAWKFQEKKLGAARRARTRGSATSAAVVPDDGTHYYIAEFELNGRNPKLDGSGKFIKSFESRHVARRIHARPIAWPRRDAISPTPSTIALRSSERQFVRLFRRTR